MKTLLTILIFAASLAHGVDTVLGRYSDLTWTGAGEDRVATFAAAGGGVLYTNIGATTNSQDFTGFANGPFTTNGWTISAGVRASAVNYNSSPASIRFFTTTSDANPYILFPLVTNGMYYIEYYHAALSSLEATNAICLQSSPDLSTWTTLWVLSHNTSVSTWTRFSTNVAVANQSYFRFFCPGVPSTSFYFDDIKWTSYTVTP